MADNFKVPSTLPDGDPGVDIHALERTVNAATVKVGVSVTVDPTDPTKRQAVDSTYGAAVDVKRLPETLPLPTGAATAVAQATGNASLSSVDGKLPALSGGRVPVDGSGVTQPVSGPLTDAQLRASAVPVSVASVPTHGVTGPLTDTELRATPVPVSASALPLPSGAATSAAQTTGNASLSSIDGKVPALGQALSAASVPVVLPAAQITTLTPPAAITGFATSAKQDTAQTSLTSIDGKLPALVSSRVPVDGSGVTQPVSAASLPLPSGAATAAKQPALGAAGTASADVLTVQGIASMTALKVDGSAVTQPVSLASVPPHAVTNAGTFAAQAEGDVAHDGVDSGKPVKVGAIAIAHGSNPTAVAAADRTNLYANRHGIPFVLGGHPNIITRRDNYTAAQTDTAIVTVSSGSKIVVTRVSATCSNANSVDVAVRVGFGGTNTPTGAGVLLSHPGVANGSGVVEGNGAGILGVGADGEDLRVTCGVPTGGSIDIITSYFVIES